jgi:acyl-CoA hydrolase
MRAVDYTNDTHVIRSFRSMTAINSAIEVDLTGQVVADSIGHRMYSGVGGQMDFIRGAALAPEGRAIIALPSWHSKADVSTVAPRLAGPVTSFQHSAIVTEQGCASVWGRGAVEQAQQLVDHAAHPDARDGLRAAGRRMGLPLR